MSTQSLGSGGLGSGPLGSGGLTGFTMPCLTIPSATMAPKALAPPPFLLTPWASPGLLHSPHDNKTFGISPHQAQQSQGTAPFSFQPPGQAFDIQAQDQAVRKQLTDELVQTKGRCASLERRASAANDELEQTKGRCASLERRASAGSAAGEENQDLRTQLAAYAVEIEVLRAKCDDMSHEKRDGHSLIQQLSFEVERSRRRIAELESERGAVEEDAQLQICRAHMEMEDSRQRAITLGETVSDLRGERETLMLQLEEERGWRGRLQHLLREAQASAESSSSQVKNQVGLEKDVGMWRGVAIDMQQALNTLQGHFAAQTSEFNNFISRVKEEQAHATDQLLMARKEIDLQDQVIEALRLDFGHLQDAHERSQESWSQHLSSEVEGWKRRAAALEAQHEAHAMAQHDALQRDKHCLQECLDEERARSRQVLEEERARSRQVLEEQKAREMVQLEKNARRLRRLTQDRVLTGLKKALSLNIARDMKELERGVVLEKVHEGNCKREPRFVAVAPEAMTLKWGKDLQLMSRNHSRLDLYEVIRIHYGKMARACVLHPSLAPWLCFSVYTPRRSFDFCCPDEAVVRRFVLGISRLCDWASGAITSRSRFMATMGWCKLEDHCFRRHMPLSRLFLEAIRRIAASPDSQGMAASPRAAAAQDEAMLRGTAGPSPLPEPMAIAGTPRPRAETIFEVDEDVPPALPEAATDAAPRAVTATPETPYFPSPSPDTAAFPSVAPEQLPALAAAAHSPPQFESPVGGGADATSSSSFAALAQAAALGCGADAPSSSSSGAYAAFAGAGAYAASSSYCAYAASSSSGASGIGSMATAACVQ